MSYNTSLRIAMFDWRVSPISRLLITGYPFAIARRIVAVIISALNAIIWWTLAHVSKKIFKQEPTFANFDSTAAVIIPCGGVWVETTRLHRAPNSVRSRVSFAMRSPMSPIFIAATRFAVTSCEIARRNICEIAASAMTTPIPAPFLRKGKSDNGQASKNLISEITWCVHQRNVNAFVNVVNVSGGT